MTKKILWATAVVALLGIVALVWAPSLVKRYVEGQYPGVRVGKIQIGMSRLVFTDVTVQRFGLRATLDRVEVDSSKRVRVLGGQVSVDVDALTGQDRDDGTDSGTPITGEGLTVNVKKGEVQASLHGTWFDARDVKFSSALVSYGPYKAVIQEGRVSRGIPKVDARNVELAFELPIPIPRLEKDQVARFEDVKMALQDATDYKIFSIEFATARMGEVLEIPSPATLRVSRESIYTKVKQIKVHHPWISPDPVTFHDLSLHLKPQEGYTGSIGLKDSHIVIQDPNLHITGFNMCNDWVGALPTPLPKALEQARGGFRGALSFDVRRNPKPDLKLKNTCRFDCSQDPIHELKSLWTEGKSFHYMAYDRNNNLFERQVGPNTKDWVYLANLPVHIPKAFITMEDPAFERHGGIIPQALENSLKDNLELGRFFRGGSTISMQLTKNIWLRRHKTLGRKVHEFLLTSALESCLSKAEILELYLNVVEFGPDLYGIGPAARHYFDKPAEALTPEESFYLASILPRPRKAVHPKDGGLTRVRGLMRNLANNGHISEHLVPVAQAPSDSGWETE